METLLFLALAAFLVFLNGFFVLAEFSAVKVRSTQIQVLAEAGDKRARRAQKILNRLDLYLSVCQVGITVASIGLGFVGEPAFTALLHPLVASLGAGWIGEVAATAIAVTAGFVLVSFLHIVLGELLPKSIAIRSAEKSILGISAPLFFFRVLFAGPIWLLNAAVTGLLKLFRVPAPTETEAHSDREIRAILDHSQASGVLSFRSLLLLENVLDFGSLTVRNAMRPRRTVHMLSLPLDREPVLEAMRTTKFSRYPVVSPAGNPMGFLHVKDVLFASPDLALDDLVRPCPRVTESDPLEKVLSLMQRKAHHLALVFNAAGLWTGIITLEDIVEELTGTIEEEYPVEPSVNLTDFLTPGQIVLDVPGSSISDAVSRGLGRLAEATLPCSREAIVQAVVDRQRLGSSYLGHHLAIPHARIDGVKQPRVFIFRLETSLQAPTGTAGETINLLFLLVTPATAHRVHQVLLSHIGGMHDSDYFEDRLLEATTAQELYDTVATVEQTALA
jgi:CBS domain containing-hemolysin-like protein/mannitol/fructose-specific phosphotransferase system IIA component (Ntr-type)